MNISLKRLLKKKSATVDLKKSKVINAIIFSFHLLMVVDTDTEYFVANEMLVRFMLFNQAEKASQLSVTTFSSFKMK